MKTIGEFKGLRFIACEAILINPEPKPEPKPEQPSNRFIDELKTAWDMQIIIDHHMTAMRYAHLATGIGTGIDGTTYRDHRHWLEKIIDWIWNNHLEIKREMRELGL